MSHTSETTTRSDAERPNFFLKKYEIVDSSDDILLDNLCDPDVNFLNLKPST